MDTQNYHIFLGLHQSQGSLFSSDITILYETAFIETVVIVHLELCNCSSFSFLLFSVTSKYLLTTDEISNHLFLSAQHW